MNEELGPKKEERGLGEGAMLSRPVPTGPADASAKGKGRESMPRKHWVAGMAVVGVLVLVAIGVWVWRRPRPPEPPVLDLAQVDPEVAEAITEARQEVVHRPFSGPAWGRLGMMLLAHEHIAEANICLAEAERLDPREPRWPYLQGTILLLSDPNSAISCLQRAVERSNDAALAPRLRLVEALLNSGRLDEADRHLEKALAQEAGDVRVQFNLGRLALERQDWRATLEHLTACVKDEHVRRRALRVRAQVYRRLGEPKQAEDDEKQVLSLPEDDNWPDPFMDEVFSLERGLVARMETVDKLRSAGRTNQAILILEETAKKYPTSSQPWLKLAEIWHGLGRIDRAEHACLRAVQSNPESAEAGFALGRIQALKRPAVAADTFRRVIRLQPEHALAHFNLASCLRHLGDSAGAADEYRVTLRCLPDYEPAQMALKELEAKNPERKGQVIHRLAK
jgi:tetratricopeptide (TPR) repeat protein